MPTSPSASSRLAHALPTLALSALLLLATFWAWLFTRVPLDDAFIYLRYADNFLAGKGLVFNVAERVDGYTSYLWMLIVIAIRTAFGSSALPVQLAGLALYLAHVPLLAAYGRWRHGASWRAWLPALLYVAAPANAIWAGSGLETMLFSVLVLSMINFYLFADQTRWPRVFVGVIGALVGMSRPEGVTVYGALLLIETGRQLATTHRLDWRQLLSYAAGLLVYAAFFVSRLRYYGYPLPNTFYVKVGFNHDVWRHGLVYLLEFLRVHAGGLAVLATVALHGVAFRRREKAFWTCAGVALALAAAVVMSGGNNWPFWRYALPLSPVLCLLFGDFFAAGFTAARHAHGAWRVMIRAAIGTLASLLIWSSTSAVLTHSRLSWFVEGNEVFHAYAQFHGLVFKRLLKPHHSIALNPMPFVAYYYGGQVYDMLGLVDAHIAHRPLRLGTGVHSHEKGDGAYIFAMRPTLIKLYGGLDLLPAPLTDYARPASLSFVSDKELMQLPDFPKVYEPYNLRIPSAGLYLEGYKLRGETLNDLDNGTIDALYRQTIGAQHPGVRGAALRTAMQWAGSAPRLGVVRLLDRMAQVLHASP